MSEPALIYNLFPPLAGTIPQWEEHLDRIAAMGFTWVFLNPIHTSGLSGSLYAVKDYYGLNPRFAPESGQDPEAALVHFLKEAGRRGLKVMLDLVINHTAIDSPLVTQHPEWYAKDENGKIKNPGAIDPADATKVTVWGDLAELEYWPPPDPEGLLHYFDGVVAKYLRLGFMGFRADAAYKIPGDFWARLIAEAKSLEPRAQFFAETLGCRLEECAQLSSSGFDFLYNSSKWWDFQEDWCLDQYNDFRHIAPSISFPESHDTERLAAESGGDPAAARQRYLFAAYFSTGVMLPIGYEYGFKKRLNVVQTRPQDWESAHLRPDPLYQKREPHEEEVPGAPGRRAPDPGQPQGGAGNPAAQVPGEPQGPGPGGDQPHRPHAQEVAIPNLAELLGKPQRAWKDLTPDTIPLKLQDSLEFTLPPARMRLFYNPDGAPLPETESLPNRL